MESLGFSFLLDPDVIKRFYYGIGVTVKISIISIIFAYILGLIIGPFGVKGGRLSYLFKFILESIRIIPLLVWLFIGNFLFFPLLNIEISNISLSILVFTIWGAFEMADIVRGAIESSSKAQLEGALALGLNKVQLYRYVIFPQALKKITPAGINLATRIIKSSSLVVLIGVTDLIKVGQQIIEVSLLKNPAASFWVYGLIFILYFLICFPLSLIGEKLEKIWSTE